MTNAQPSVLLIAMAIAVVMGMVWMLFCRRTRTLAIGLMGIAALGLLFQRLSDRPNWVVPADGVLVHSGVNVMDPHLVEARRHARQVRQVQSEILRNQRLAARMDDAFVQESPDGSRLETYPDGMQIRQSHFGGFRSIVRTAGGDVQWTHAHGPYWRVMFGILGASLLLLLIVFLAIKARRPERRWSGRGWVALTVGLLLIGALFFVGTESRFVATERRTAVIEPMRQRLADDGLLSASEAAVAEVPLVQPAASSPETAQRSLDEAWNHASRPKIPLDQASLAEAAGASGRDMAAAAVKLLSQPGSGQPFTLSWLASTAKDVFAGVAKRQSEAQPAGPPRAAPVATATVAADRPVSPDGKAAIPAAAAPAPVAVAPESSTLSPTVAAPPTSGSAGRPAWVDHVPKSIGDTRKYVISTDPYVTVDECYANLRQKLQVLVQARILELARELNGGSEVVVPNLRSMGVGMDYILSELCPEDDYVETLQTSVGQMKRAYALVEFNETQDEMLLDRWRTYARREGIFNVAAISAGLLAGLAFAYGMLKIDTWTRGYYTKRLFLGVPAAIIAVGLAMGAMLGLIG